MPLIPLIIDVKLSFIFVPIFFNVNLVFSIKVVFCFLISLVSRLFAFALLLLAFAPASFAPVFAPSITVLVPY
jgi:hypothetical protein